ncbi:hypothetical protein CSUI_010532 [Cystoisospora suis]|uniref:Uncharacterized protein n=1 Tax=Cystoisospora suis TaxID=483139 RepID=A0A2C6KG52_9APIC|nr:hypothetical protein CSUI_010532 [Cystoisospora suis]
MAATGVPVVWEVGWSVRRLAAKCTPPTGYRSASKTVVPNCCSFFDGRSDRPSARYTAKTDFHSGR